jgi:hypothetical protein
MASVTTIDAFDAVGHDLLEEIFRTLHDTTLQQGEAAGAAFICKRLRRRH